MASASDSESNVEWRQQRDEQIYTDLEILPKIQDDSIQRSVSQTANEWVSGPISDCCGMGECEKSHRATTAYEIMIQMRRWVTEHKFMRIIKNNLYVCFNNYDLYFN